MKNFLCLFAVAIMIISCGKKSAESSYIPKDAIGVMYVNLESLSKKSEGVDFKNLKLSQVFEKEAPKEMQDFMNEYVTAENIDATFRKEFLLGYVSVDRMTGTGGFIIPIKSAAAFEKMIQPLLEKSSMQKEENVGKNDAFTVYSTGQMAIGWNDKTALIIGARDYASTELIDLTNMDSSDNIYTTNYFKRFFDTDKDMGVHISSTPLATLANSLASMLAGIDINLENNNFYYHMNFEDDRIHSEAKLNLNDDFESLIGHKSWMTTSYESSLLKAIPENPSFLLKVSINPTALYDHIEGLQDNRIIPKEARAELKQGFRNMNRGMKREVGMTGKDLAEVFEGSMLLSLSEGKTIKDTIHSYDYYTDEDEYEILDIKIPNVYSAIAIKDKAKFDALMTVILKKEAPKATKGKDYYELGNNMFAVITDDFLFLTNDEAKADEVYANGSLAANLSNFEHKSYLSHSVYMFMTPNATEMYGNFLSSYTSRLNSYGSFSTDFSTESAELYKKYFADTHYFLDADGMESYTYTKGENNSWINLIQYSDAIANQAANMAKKF